MFVTWDIVPLLMPEITLVILATWIYLGGTSRTRRNRYVWTIIALATYVTAGLELWIRNAAHNWELWHGFFDVGGGFLTGPLVIDFLGNYFRWFALLLGLLFTLLASRSADQRLRAEFVGTLMLLVVGLMFVASANELVFLFLGLEMISIPTYVLLFLGRRDRAAAEATAKYFFLSILSSAVLLYGFSFLYGIAGTTNLSQIYTVLKSSQIDGGGALSAIALVLIVAGLGFKIAAVPFHFYAPDVYQGTTNANAALLAVVPKVAGIIALVRLMTAMLPVAQEFAWQLSLALAMLTMTIGNICALWQNNMRRLMAYSSIAHAGYMLIGLATGLAFAPSGGIAAMLFYLSVYVFASLGTFAALAYLGSDHRDVCNVDELGGLARTQPMVAGVIALCMFSLAGIPPLAGFWGKFSLFSSTISLALQTDNSPQASWFVALAIVGALNAAIAAAYYLRVVSVMFFRSSSADVPAKGGMGAFTAMSVCAILVILIGIVPGPVARWSELAESASLNPAPLAHVPGATNAAESASRAD